MTVGFHDSGCYDGRQVRQIVAGGDILWAVDACSASGPCGMCEEFCPTGVLDLSGGVDGAGPLGELVCIRCRLCVATCPVGALSFSALPRSG